MARWNREETGYARRAVDGGEGQGAVKYLRSPFHWLAAIALVAAVMIAVPILASLV